jgi:hypothetical protein
VLIFGVAEDLKPARPAGPDRAFRDNAAFLAVGVTEPALAR